VTSQCRRAPEFPFLSGQLRERGTAAPRMVGAGNLSFLFLFEAGGGNRGRGRSLAQRPAFVNFFPLLPAGFVPWPQGELVPWLFLPP